MREVKRRSLGIWVEKEHLGRRREKFSDISGFLLWRKRIRRDGILNQEDR